MYKYVWGNNMKRKTYKGRICKVLAKGKMNSICIEFENGERTITSRYAIRNMNKKLKFNQSEKLPLPDDLVSSIKFSPTTDESYIGKMVKPGYIQIVDNKIFFEPDGLKKPKKIWFKTYNPEIQEKAFNIALKAYEASKQLIEVINEYDPFKVDKSLYWILLSNKDLPVNWHVTENNQPCKAEVENDKATIIELLT